MKPTKAFAAIAALAILFTACSTAQPETPEAPIPITNVVEIQLDDAGIKVSGSTDSQAVYTEHDIIYYETGHDFTYGEGTEADGHSAEEAAAHTVVHITQPGTYSISGTLSKGQIAVDLGEDAKDDPNAVVTLILNGADITCDVAPAIIFYNVYECGTTDAEQATKDVDTSAAGANVIIADGTINTVNGSYVARIYKPDSIILSEDGTEVEDAKKLHKYDGAFYSKMSMNITGGEENTGILYLNAKNEGLGSELHLTINGGIIHIKSGNDGINTNEDGISVTTVNDGTLTIQVTGETGEGDGIDSNGWLVINGGTVAAEACSNSADAGIDSDMGIHINGGTVLATGHMLDRIEDGGQNYAVFSFAKEQDGGQTVSLKNEKSETVMEHSPSNDYSILIYSSPDLTEGTYTLWCDGMQLAGQSGGMRGGPGMPGTPPEGFEPPDDFNPPEPPDGKQPLKNDTVDGKQPPEGMTPPEGEKPSERPELPEGKPHFDGMNHPTTQETTPNFAITQGGNMFQSISPLET